MVGFPPTHRRTCARTPRAPEAALPRAGLCRSPQAPRVHPEGGRELGTIVAVSLDWNMTLNVAMAT
eukprot:1058707-Prorocentrum_lima.AAC.1